MRAALERGTTNLGATALMCAAAAGREAAAALLLDRGADLAKRHGDNDLTPLMYTIIHSHRAAMRLLLDRGADPNAACMEWKLAASSWSTHAVRIRSSSKRILESMSAPAGRKGGIG